MDERRNVKYIRRCTWVERLLTRSEVEQVKLVYQSIDESRWHMLWFLYAFELTLSEETRYE